MVRGQYWATNTPILTTGQKDVPMITRQQQRVKAVSHYGYDTLPDRQAIEERDRSHMPGDLSG